jgi:hypothetical protein
MIALLLGTASPVAGQNAAVPPRSREEQELAGPRPEKGRYHLFNPVPLAGMREMEALYENPYTVDAGHVQVETYPFGYRRDHDRSADTDTVIEGWTFAPTTLRLGLLDNLDAHVSLAPYTTVRTTDRLTSQTGKQRGFGDVVARVRWNVWGNDVGSTAFGVTPFLKVPTSQDGLGNDAYEAGVVLALAAELPLGWWVVSTPELDVNKDWYSSGYHAEFAHTLYFWHSIVGDLSGWAEFYSRVSGERSVPWVGTVDFGLTFMLTRNLQLDAGTRVGVTRSADDINPFLGISVRF